MKRLLLSVICLCSLAAGAQKNYLIKMEDDLGTEYLAYDYNENDKLDSMYISEPYIDHYELYTYNEDGNIIKTRGFDYKDDDYKHTSYIDYIYNDKKQMVQRLNYNNFSGWQQGGRLSYSYNEDGKLAKLESELYYGPDNYKKYLEDQYFYDDKGRLIRIDEYDFFFNSEGELSAQIVYGYDGDTDHVTSIKNYTISYGTSTEGKMTGYEYDENGNVIKEGNYYPNGNDTYRVTSLYEYKYDTNVSRADLVLPFDFEKPDYVMENTKNKILSKDMYLPDENTGELTHVATYDLTYKTTSGIGSTRITKAIRPFTVSPDHNRLFSSTDLTGKNVNVYDIAGRMVRGYVVCGNSVDISMLRSGVYVIKVDGKSVKFRK